MTTPIYVFDTAPSNRRRPWATMLGVVSDVQWNRSDVCFQSQSSPIREGIVVVHWGQFLLEGFLTEADAICALKTFSSGSRNTLVIVVSGAVLEAGPQGPRCYFRKAPVAVEMADQEFAQCFGRFYESAQRQNPDFSLLEPPHLPCLSALAILCQGYLFARRRYDLLGSDAPRILHPLADHHRFEFRRDWWQRPFVGMNATLESAVTRECRGNIPEKLRKLLHTPDVPDDEAVANAWAELQQLLVRP